MIAVEPMVNMGTKQVKSLPDHWTQVTARRPAQRPFRAHGRHDRERPVGADRPAGGRRNGLRSFQAKRAD